MSEGHSEITALQSNQGQYRPRPPPPGFQILEPWLLYLACCVLPRGYKTSIRHSIEQDHPTQSKTKCKKLTRLPPQKESVPAVCPSVAARSLLHLVICSLAAHAILSLQCLPFPLFWDFALQKSDRLSEKLSPNPVTSGVSSPGKHIVPTVKVYSPKSSSCIFIRMKYRVLCSVQGLINAVLSGAACSAYLHIKQLSEETFLLLLQGINQFKASSHHLYSFQLSLLLLK